MNIKNTSKPFEIHIPHQKNTLLPSMFYENISLFSNNLQVKYYSINLTHNLNLSLSLHIDIQPTNLQLSYLFTIRFNDTPENLFDDQKILCPKGNFIF